MDTLWYSPDQFQIVNRQLSVFPDTSVSVTHHQPAPFFSFSLVTYSGLPLWNHERNFASFSYPIFMHTLVCVMIDTEVLDTTVCEKKD